MQSINFEMIHKGLKPSRSARQLQDTLSQEFLISSETSNQTQTLKFGLTANQSNKYAFRPGGDSDECNTHHSEEITQIDECTLFPSHNLNIRPVAEMRINSQFSENKYQQDTYQVIDDLNKQNYNQYQLSSSQGFDQLKRRSNSKPPLSRNNSTNNKDEITQFRGTEHCIAMNNSNSRKNSLASLGCGAINNNNFQLNDEENYVKQKVLINNKDLLQYNVMQQQQQNLQNPYSINNMQNFQPQTIESNRITPNNPYPDNPLIELQQNLKLNYKIQEAYDFQQNKHSFSNQQQDGNQNDWIKEYQAANIPIPLQRVSSPKGLTQYQDNKYFISSSSSNNQQIKQNEDQESLKPEDLLMSQKEYSRFQEVQKLINQQQLNQQSALNGDLSFNTGLQFQNSMQNNANIQNQYQSVQSIQNNNQTPFASLNSDVQNSQHPSYQPAQFNFNQTYSFSNSQFRQCTIPISQQQNQIHSLQESGFNPEKQLNSISSSSILNIQSPKTNTTAINILQQVPSQNIQIQSEKDGTSLQLQQQKENQSNNISQTQQNKKNTVQPKKTNFLKRNQSLSYLSTSPINQKGDNSQMIQAQHNKSSNQNADKQQNNLCMNQTPISKTQNRCVTPQPQPRLERKLSENLLLDKSKKKKESFEDQQLKECTFKPQINKSSQKMQRSFSQFLETQVNYNKYKSDKQKILQEQAHYALNVQVKDKPDINKNSQRIIEQKRNNDYHSLFGVAQVVDQQEVYNRLYSIHKRNESNNSQIRKKIEEEANKENTFTPQIHQRSKSIKRDEKIQDILYKDAVRRNNIQQNISNQKPRSNSKYTSEKSEKILLKKFIKEIDYIFQSLSVNQNKNIQNHSQNASRQNSPINYLSNLDMASLFEVMIKSGFVKYNSNSSNPDMIVMENEKKLIFLIWTLLGGKHYNFISKQNLLLFLIIILNLDKSFDQSERSLLLKEPSFSMSNSQQQNTSPLSSQASIKNFKNFEAFTSIISSNVNSHPHSAQVSPLNKSNSSGFSASSHASNIHQQLNQSLMKSYSENYINLSLGSFDEKQQWIVNEEDKQVIRQAFEIFYRNRLSYEELKSQKSPVDQGCTFHPNILQNSKNMANQYREKLLILTANLLENKEIQYQVPKDGKIQHSDFLILQKRAQEIQHKNKQEIIKEKELVECTFKPTIYSKPKKEKENEKNIAEIGFKKTEELYQQSKNKEIKQVKDNNDLDYEKQKNECTFQPEITDNRNKKMYDGGIFAKNINKTIERMRNARKEKELINAMKQRGYNSVNQLVRHQKSVSSTSTVQMEQTSENFQPKNTRKDETNKNFANTSQHFSNNTNSGVERVTSINSCTANSDNLMIYYNSNQSVVNKNSPSQNYQQDNMQGLQYQQNQSLLNNNMFANQALQQYQQKNSPVSVLQHSFAQQTGTIQYNQLNNNVDESNNLMLNQIMNTNLLEQQNQENIDSISANNYHNPLLELSAPKFGRLQETQMQNSWQQNNFQANQEQYQNTAEECKPFSSEQGQESVQSATDSKDRPPLLFVDVNLGNQRSERIIVNEGDNPKQLAYDFARLHGLDDQTAEKLYQLLENQIAGLLSRIEEEENISHLENLD